MMLKILVVDDSSAIRLVYERLIVDTWGHRMMWASSALSAIELIQREEIDLVLLDVELQGTLSGIDVARHVPRKIPIVVVSGHGEEYIREIERNTAHPLASVEVFMGKPIDPSTLLREIQRVERAKTP